MTTALQKGMDKNVRVMHLAEDFISHRTRSSQRPHHLNDANRKRKEVASSDTSSSLNVPHKKTIRLRKNLPEDFETVIFPKAAEIKAQRCEYIRELDHTLQLAGPRSAAAGSFRSAFDSVVLFAQYDAGTGVCISKTGVVLTCAHCLGDHPRRGMRKTLIFTDGSAYVATAVAVNRRSDLALLQITEAVLDQHLHSSSNIEPLGLFPSCAISESGPQVDDRLLCIGQPGRDDLECTGRSRKTGYPLVSSSLGSYHGTLVGDLLDNSHIGKLKHSCWTYWGHSGAPLLCGRSGEVVGMHSSWDESTGMRHGIHAAAIRDFLSRNKQLLTTHLSQS